MPAIAVNPPFPLFTDADGQALDDAYIYIGTANQNPVSNPITVYWDSALTITAAQPIRTSGGYPVYNGSPARFYTNSNYSILLRDKNGAFIYTSASETDFISSEFVTFIQSGTGAVATTVQAKLRETVSVKDFGATGDGVTDDTAAIQAAIDSLYSGTIQGGTLFFPKGTYKVTSSIYQKPRVSFLGEGSRQSTITWGGASAPLSYSAVVYCVNGSDASPDFVFSTNIQGLGVGGNNIAPVSLAIRGHQENCRFTDILLGSFTTSGLDILPFTSINHAVSFEDIHIIPQSGTTSAVGIKASHVQKCNFKNITTDVSSGSYLYGIRLYNNPLLNVFESIHTEDCQYGFYVEGGANNVFIGVEAQNGVANGVTHFYTTGTRYQIQGIRTISGFTNQLNDGTNVITASTDTDSVSIKRGGSYFNRVADSLTSSITINGTRLARGVDAYAGTSGNGQTYLRINDSIGTSATRYVTLALGAGAVGFSGQIKVFSIGSQRFITTAYFEGFAASDGTVSGGAISANTGSPASNVTIGAPQALSPATIGSIRIPITNGSPSFAQTVEILVEIVIAGRQATGISVA